MTRVSGVVQSFPNYLMSLNVLHYGCNSAQEIGQEWFGHWDYDLVRG